MAAKFASFLKTNENLEIPQAGDLATDVVVRPVISSGEPVVLEPVLMPAGAPVEPIVIDPVAEPVQEPIVSSVTPEPTGKPIEVVGEGALDVDDNIPLEMEDIPGADEADEVEAEAELETEVTEIAELNKGLDLATDGISRIEELKDMTEDAIKTDGGLSETEAGVIEVTHESIMSALDMSHRRGKGSKNPVSTMESYRQPKTKLTASMVTMEKLSESVNQLKSQVSDGIRKFIEMITGMVSRFIKETFTMQGQAKKFLAQAKAIPDNATPKNSYLQGSAVKVTVDSQANYRTAITLVGEAEKMVSICENVAREASRRMDGSKNPVSAYGGDSGNEVTAGLTKLEGIRTVNGGKLALTRMGYVDAEGESPAKQATAPTRAQVLEVVEAVVAASERMKRSAEDLNRAFSSIDVSVSGKMSGYLRDTLSRLANIASVSSRRNLVAALSFAKQGAGNLEAPKSAK